MPPLPCEVCNVDVTREDFVRRYRIFSVLAVVVTVLAASVSPAAADDKPTEPGDKPDAVMLAQQPLVAAATAISALDKEGTGLGG